MAGGETLCKPRLVGGRTPSYQAWRCTAVCGETIVAGYIRPLQAPFFKCLNLGNNFRSCKKWTYNNGDLEWPLSNIRTCPMNPYYKLYVYFLGPKILTEIETLKAKLKKGAAVCGETIVASYIRPLWQAAATVVAWLLPCWKGVGAASSNKQLGTR